MPREKMPRKKSHQLVWGTAIKTHFFISGAIVPTTFQPKTLQKMNLYIICFILDDFETKIKLYLRLQTKLYD